MKKCVFCSIIKNNKPFHEIIWQDENHRAFLDAFSWQDGHTQVIPKKHINYLFDLKEKDYVELLKATREVAILLKKTFKCKRVGVAVEGFSVPHVHIHLAPLNSGADFTSNHKKGVLRSANDLLCIANKIRRNLPR